MPKTYTALTVANATAGNAILASDFSSVFTNLNNMRVPPAARIHRAAALSQTATGGYQTVAFDTETFTNTDGMWAAGTPSRITLTTAGLYLLTASATLTTVGTGIRAIRIIVTTGASSATVIETGGVNGSAAGYQNAVTTWSCAANDYVTVDVFQNSGGNLAYSVGSQSVFLSAAWLGQVS
jgi:hypothetical protein